MIDAPKLRADICAIESFSFQYSFTFFPAQGGAGYITVNAPMNCPWIITTSSPWIALFNAVGIGSGTFGITVSPNTGPFRSGILIFNGGPALPPIPQLGTTQLPTFSITDLQLPIGTTTETVKSPAPVQVVFNPHSTASLVLSNPDPGPFDLVLGKSTAFFIGLKVDQVALVPSRGVEVQVVFANAPPLPPVFVIPQCPSWQTTNCFQPDGTATAVINPGFAPQTAGNDLAVLATVNPADANHIPEGDGSTGGKTAPPITVNVKSTQLAVAYVPLSSPNLQPLQSFDFTVNSSDQFIKTVFPVAESPVTAVPVAEPIQAISIAKDLLAVANAGSQAGATVTKSIGVVPKDYFTHFGFSSAVQGITLTWVSDMAGLVMDGSSTTAAHELGHTFGFNNPPLQEEDKLTSPLPGNPASGFNVLGNLFITNSYCFMGLRQPVVNTWVDQIHYSELFNVLKTNPTDPELFTVSAVVHSDGTLELQPSYILPAGVPTPIVPGDYTVSVFTAGGQTLSSTSVPLAFELNVEPIGPQSTDAVPLFVKVPYPATAALVVLRNNNQTIAQFNIPTKLLADAVLSLPDAGFTQNSSQRRNALLNKIAALDSQLSNGAIQGAINNLQNDIRKSLDNWLIDGYTVQSFLQYSKPQILSLVDELVRRLQG